MNKKNIIIILVFVVIIAIFIIFIMNNKSIFNSQNAANIEEYAFEYEGKEIKIGDNFLDLGLPESQDVYEAESCAFDGIEKTYNYENFEIVTAVEEDKETIIGIYLLNDEVSTKEGAKIGDSSSKIKKIYGDADEEKEDISYTYKKDNATLTFVFKNGFVINIDYDLSNIE